MKLLLLLSVPMLHMSISFSSNFDTLTWKKRNFIKNNPINTEVLKQSCGIRTTEFCTVLTYKNITMLGRCINVPHKTQIPQSLNKKSSPFVGLPKSIWMHRFHVWKYHFWQRLRKLCFQQSKVKYFEKATNLKKSPTFFWNYTQ